MRDNILDSDCLVLVNTTNIQGVMGAGLAKQFAQRFPKMYEAYKLECAMGGSHRLREMLFYHDKDSGKIICNFPTMERPGMRADIRDIEEGLRDLRRAIMTSKDCDFLPTITSIAVPALGCGIGRLPWPKVEKLIHHWIGHLNGLRVDIYPPEGAKYTYGKSE